MRLLFEGPRQCWPAVSPLMVLKQAAVWGLVAIFPNLLWEIGQLHWYAIADDTSTASLAFAVGHCTLGDAWIAAASFVLASVLVADPFWPTRRPWLGGLIATLFGLVYTTYSEWYNVYEATTWAYSSRMPLVFGIGLFPLLQWLVIPPLTVALIHLFQLALFEPGHQSERVSG
jgi:hypothetical protein